MVITYENSNECIYCFTYTIDVFVMKTTPLTVFVMMFYSNKYYSSCRSSSFSNFCYYLLITTYLAMSK